MSSPQRSSETGCWPGCISLLSPLPIYSCPQRLCTHRADWPRIQAAETGVKCSKNTQTGRERWWYGKITEKRRKTMEELEAGDTEGWKRLKNGNAETFISSVDLLEHSSKCVHSVCFLLKRVHPQDKTWDTDNRASAESSGDWKTETESLKQASSHHFRSFAVITVRGTWRTVMMPIQSEAQPSWGLTLKL